MANVGGNLENAALLEEARLRSGFLTADEAANHHGWDRSAYWEMEEGLTRITPKFAGIFAAAFGVDPETLLQERGFDERRLNKLETSNNRRRAALERHRNKEVRVRPGLTPLERGRVDMGARVRFAATMRDFSATVRHRTRFGIAFDLIRRHEKGEEKISDRFLLAYAAAYSVRKEWLETGNLPSGLGREVDLRIAARDLKGGDLVDQADRLRPLADPPDPVSSRMVMEMFRVAANGLGPNVAGVDADVLLDTAGSNPSIEVEVLRALTGAAYAVMDPAQKAHYLGLSQVRTALGQALGARRPLPEDTMEFSIMIRKAAERARTERHQSDSSDEPPGFSPR